MSFWDNLFSLNRTYSYGQDGYDRHIAERAGHAADMAHLTAVDTQSEVKKLRTEVERLHLVVEAMSELMSVRLGVSRYEIGMMIERVDLADGVVDGRIGPDRVKRAMKCPFCDRPVNPKREECIYCGQRYKAEDLEIARQRRQAELEQEDRLERLKNAKYFCSDCAKEVAPDDIVFGSKGIFCQDCA